jgi:hypothetical protein
LPHESIGIGAGTVRNRCVRWRSFQESNETNAAEVSALSGR